ncbi:MAG: DUF7681 family protein [Azonexus sp.]
MRTPEDIAAEKRAIAHEDVANRLSHHSPTPDTVDLFELNRASAKALAHQWVDTLPPGRHAALAQTALQEALMWANAAIACDS